MNTSRKIIGYLFSLVLALLMVLVIINRNFILDSIALVNYKPSDYIVKLADNSGMSDYARRVFYVHKPQLLSEYEFNNVCSDNEETIVLGCYDGRNIYIYDVDNPELDGIKEVTAAHEMLHAQYNRLSGDKKKEINNLIEQQLDIIKNDRILQNIDTYRSKDPGIVINEAHSIFGTEVEILLPDLEDYYSKYFDNRMLVVQKSLSYEKVFSDIKNKVIEYDKNLYDFKIKINNLEDNLQNRVADLISWSLRLEELRNNNLIVEYNAEVLSYNASVENYRRDVAYLNDLISRYNKLVVDRNEVALQQNELYKSIDSKATEL